MGRFRFLALVLTIGIVATSCSDTGTLEAEIARQEVEIGVLSVQLAEQADALTTMESGLKSVASSVASLDVPQDVSGEFVGLRNDVDSAIAAARAAESVAEDAESIARDAYDRAEDVAACVNEYMDVIGRWSSNVDSYFRYSYC